MDKKNYLLITDKTSKEVIYIDYNKMDGYKFKPQNNINYDGIEVNKLILVKPSLIEKIIKKKIKRKLDEFLNFLMNILDAEEETDSETLKEALNELSKYRMLIMNKYRSYLEDKYIDLLIKKITLLENEINNKLVYKEQLKEEKQRGR